MPLSFAKVGKEMKIKKITGKDDTIKFLNRLGLIEGHNVKIVSRVSGNVILNVKDTRVALDRQLSNRIII